MSGAVSLLRLRDGTQLALDGTGHLAGWMAVRAGDWQLIQTSTSSFLDEGILSGFIIHPNEVEGLGVLIR